MCNGLHTVAAWIRIIFVMDPSTVRICIRMYIRRWIRPSKDPSVVYCRNFRS